MAESVNEALLQLSPDVACTRRRQAAFTRGVRNGLPDGMARLGHFKTVGLRRNTMVPLALSRLDVSDADKGDQHGEKAESVEEEISGHADERHGKAAQSWSEHARHVELRGVERDGVGEVFSRHKSRHQRLIGWRIQ